jgi:tripartite-type tricarboxylate transporter receptor subunit TctC
MHPDLMGGQIDLAVETCSILLPHLRDGSLRPLGTPSPNRLPQLPDVPTMAESDAPGFLARARLRRLSIKSTSQLMQVLLHLRRKLN